MRRYHVYVTVALLIPVLIGVWLASLFGPIWLKIIAFLVGWAVSLFIMLEICWQLVIWWNRRQREKTLKVSR